MTTPGSGAAEIHGFDLRPDGRAIPAAEPATPWLPELPVGFDLEGGNGTGPHEYPRDGAEPVAGDPEEVVAAVAAGQPGTWPTSAFGLDDGPPEPVAPASPSGVVTPSPAPSPAGGGVELFAINTSIEPIGDDGDLKLSFTAAGPAGFVKAMLDTIAYAFVEEVAARRES